MIENLLFGFPFDRPGGLLLSIIYFITAGGIAFVLALFYSHICISYKNVGFVLQGMCTLIRGVPLLFLVFLFANLPAVSSGIAGLIALTIYSLTHVGEILRGFLNAYPRHLREQAKAMGFSKTSEWLQIRIPWTISKSLPAVLTHWVSLLKDSGALLIIGVGELATVAKSISELSTDYNDWIEVLLVTAMLYFFTTLILIKIVNYFGNKIFSLNLRYN